MTEGNHSNKINENFDVIVVGGGHAGCEAAIASAKLGLSTALFTLNIDRIAWQPCNPAVGGPAKSQLVHEVDALGGIIGQIADATAIQKRVLNESRGPAVWALRAQTDKRKYSQKMINLLHNTPNLLLKEGMITDLKVEFNKYASENSQDDCIGKITGVQTYFGTVYQASAVILTAGTFLNGQIWIGNKSMSSGRAGEQAAHGLTESLRNLGFKIDRLKTGTPARVDRNSINFNSLIEQPSTAQNEYFSFDPKSWKSLEQISCHITRTTSKTHKIIRDNLHLSPIYGGFINSKGPRYCPSIEDKIVRFADKESHQIFLEPEGIDTPEIYVQGFSTGLPEIIQLELLRSLPGLENCVMLRSAYSVEYDYLQGTQLNPSLETKRIEGLFTAGQLNGTTGYEEAAAQGLIAGINASRKVKGLDPFCLSRESSYIGTMIDDLINIELKEPYRVLTSRSEYRLTLRGDNADRRLTNKGREIGLIDNRRWGLFLTKLEQIEAEKNNIKSIRIKHNHPLAESIKNLIDSEIKGSITLTELIKRPQVHIKDLVKLGLIQKNLCSAVANSIEIDIKYSGYLKRQQNHIDQINKQSNKILSPHINYNEIKTISLEAREKLSKVQPSNFGIASQLPGVSKADLNALLVWLKIQDSREVNNISIQKQK
tara:strand:- start:641 stop:2608 length:1968 start_codon:yes stop_codon:yes gene_type:complete